MSTSRKRSAIIVIGVIFIAILIFALCSKNESSKAESVAKSFVEYTLNGKPDKAFKYVSDLMVEESGAATRKIFQNTFVNNVESVLKQNKSVSYKKIKVIDSYYPDIPATSSLANYEVIQVVLEGEYKKNGLLSSKDGKDTMNIVLIKERGSWKVYNFS